jgi:DNA modification methylase
MAITAEVVTEKYAAFCGDCMEVLPKMGAGKVGLSIYSPPFCGLYNYSSSERDFSNCLDYEEFMAGYELLVRELHRVTMPGRMTVIHCMDLPSGNTGRDHMVDFPGDIIRLHERNGWKYTARYAVWKDPFKVYLRTLQKNIRHRTVVDDSARCSNAAADYMIVMRREGENPVPIAHPVGLMTYAGGRTVPKELLKYRGWPGKQTENKYSQWIWRQYASAFWDDVRLDRVLPYRDCKEPDDERHVHATQLDVLERSIVLWSNPGETVFTPFLGVGSEVFAAVINGRVGAGAELKESYWRQAVENLKEAASGRWTGVTEKQVPMFEDAPPMDDDSDEVTGAA